VVPLEVRATPSAVSALVLMSPTIFPAVTLTSTISSPVDAAT
jgi:hypothetical protein